MTVPLDMCLGSIRGAEGIQGVFQRRMTSENEERAVRDLRSGLLGGCPLDMCLGSMRGAEGGRVSF